MSDSWQIEHLPEAERDIKRFRKQFKGKDNNKYYLFYFSILDRFTDKGIHPDARREPLPGGVELPPKVELWKILVDIPWLTGAISELRILYLRFISDKRILIIMVYTHKDYAKRPPDRIIAKLLKEQIKEK